MMDPRARRHNNMAHRFPDPSDPIWKGGLVNRPDNPDPRDLKPETPNAGHYRAGRNPIPGRPWRRYFKTMLSVAVVIAIGTPLLVRAIEWAVDVFLLGGR